MGIAIQEITEEEVRSTVADYWAYGRGWKWDRLENKLPEGTKDKLAGFVVCEDDQARDGPKWAWEESGQFSVSSAYVHGRGEEETQGNEGYKNLWQLKVPNKIHTFLWTAKKRKIMCNHERAKRGFTSNAGCPLCGASCEDVEHVLRNCLTPRKSGLNSRWTGIMIIVVSKIG